MIKELSGNMSDILEHLSHTTHPNLGAYVSEMLEE
jgi:hypothetical protein